MNEEHDRVTPTEDDGRAAVAWLRDVLANSIDVAPLSPWIKEATQRCIRHLPNWIMTAWAKALNFDHVTAYRACPDLAGVVKSDEGMQIVKQYVETHNAVPLANTLHQLARKISRMSRAGKLPASADIIEQQVCAMGMADCMPQGEQFIQQAGSILYEAERSNHPLVEYQVLLEGRQSQKLNEIDAILSRHPYNSWVAERIVEIKRWLGLELPTFRVKYGERTPEWDMFWKSILLGGRNGQ